MVRRAVLQVIAVLGLAGALAAADPAPPLHAPDKPADTPAPVDDPIGLGERLALIDWLHAHQVDVPEGADLGALRVLYWKVAAPGPTPEEEAAADLAAKQARLRKALFDQYKDDQPAGATLEQMQDAMDRHQREDQARIVAEVEAKEKAHDGADANNGGAAADPGPGQIDRLKRAVVLVVVPNRGTGSGFFVSTDGQLVTNFHVVGSATATVQVMWDGTVKRPSEWFKVQTADEAQDLALLVPVKPRTDYTALSLSAVYDLGRPVMTAGYPLAGAMADTLGTSPSDLTVSRGTISAVRRDDGTPRFIQTDCRIASGSSGGPLIDVRTCAVLGVNSMVLSTDRVGAAGDGLNLCIPAEVVRKTFHLP
jgi:S1-C subfamily serine protease